MGYGNHVVEHRPLVELFDSIRVLEYKLLDINSIGYKWLDTIQWIEIEKYTFEIHFEM